MVNAFEHPVLAPLRQLAARPVLASLSLGILSATGFRPLALWPLALLAMGLFAHLIAHTASWRRAAWLGWIFGLGHFTLGNNWIATAFTYQSNMPAILGWAAVPLLSLYLALFPALACGLARSLLGTAPADARRTRFIAPALAGSWIISEWMRAWVLTGYAWNPFGIILLGPFDRPGLAAIAPWIGTYALSGFAVLIAGALATALLQGQFVRVMFAGLLLVAGMYWPAGEERRGTLPLTIVQPDLTQARLNNPQLWEDNYQRLARLSRPRRPGERRLVLWPESGLVDYLRDGYPQRYYDRTTALGDPSFARRRIGLTIGGGSKLLTGAVDLEIGDDRAIGAYNSVTALDAQGNIAGGYAKAHLVPFGEFLPFRGLLEPLGLSRLVPGSLDFIPGPGPQTLDLGEHGKAGIQICYEIVFSGQVTQRDDRPDYIFNPSNDGWFGAFGPPQHLAQARLRAIEEGLPVLRATTTGISAVIDAQGIVRDFRPIHALDRIDTIVPPAAPPKLFARFGNIVPLLIAGLFLAGTGVAIKRARR